MYFDPTDEPDDFFFELAKELDEWLKKNRKHISYLHCKFDNPKDYYNILSALEKYTDDHIKVYGTSLENTYDLIINEDSDMDDNTKPSTIGLQKKRKKKTAEDMAIEMKELEEKLKKESEAKEALESQEEEPVEEEKEEKPKRKKKKETT